MESSTEYKIIEHPSVIGCYAIKYKKKWWHKWRFIGSDNEVRIWYTLLGAQNYVDIKTNNIKLPSCEHCGVTPPIHASICSIHKDCPNK